VNTTTIGLSQIEKVPRAGIRTENSGMETGTAYVVTRSNDGAAEQCIFTHSYTKDASCSTT